MGRLDEYDEVERRLITGHATGQPATDRDNRDQRRLVHVEHGTPSQVVHGWDELAKQERKPS